MRIHFSLAGPISLLAVTAFAQLAGTRPPDPAAYAGERDGIVRGQVSSDDPFVDSLSAELVAPGRGGTLSASVEAGGGFEFHGVPPGQYQLRLTAVAGTIIHEQSVLVTGGLQNLYIQLPKKPKTERLGGSTVSIRQLQHKVVREAQKEFDKGNSASRKGDQSIALEHFQNAVRIDPEFADAFNGMGESYATLREFQQAADQFQKTIDLVPDHARALANLSIALCKLEHFHEAGNVARRALKLDPSRLIVRYVLGISLVADGGNKAEALDNLQLAAAEIPKARLLAAKILDENGRRKDAVTQVEEYLRSSPASDSDREKAGAWLDHLRQ